MDNLDFLKDMPYQAAMGALDKLDFDEEPLILTFHAYTTYGLYFSCPIYFSCPYYHR
jgi:hypothetical protein